MDFDEINKYNKKLYDKICKDGKYYLHNFPITIPNNKFNYDKQFMPLRYMSGNDLVDEKELDLLIDYLKKINLEIE